MEQLLLKHYTIQKDKGWIKPETTVDQFMEKISEEYSEVGNAYCDDVMSSQTPSNEFNQELFDLVMVVFHYFQHYGVDFRDELLKNIAIQETRIKKI